MDSDHAYELSAELVGHDGDVRGILGTRNGRIVTTSRDNTGRIWSDDGVEGWMTSVVLTGHTRYVSPVLETTDGSIVTGGYDKMAIVWNPITGEPGEMLIGHEEAVVSLGQTISGELLTGSWDQTIRVWRNGKEVQVLRGHSQSVWGVAGAPNGDIWSASADKTVKIWRNGNCIKTLSESSDCVRGIHIVPGAGVLVASNDSTVRLYSFDGDLLRQLVGHTSYVYAVTSVGPEHDLLVSGSEDCSVKIWRGSECIQTIEFPENVWDVSTLPNGDLLIACADGVARVYTRDPKRAASEEVRKTFDQRMNLAQEKAAEAAMKQMDLSQYPGYEALAVDGKREGQTLVVRKSDGKGAQAYNWSKGEWVLIGDVMGPKDGNASGKDYEFPVELNGSKYRIMMNRGDNVYETASQFVEDNNLSGEHLDQIVDFLHQNTASQDARESESGGGASRPKPVQELSYNPGPWAEAAPPKPKAAVLTNFVLFDVPGNLAGLSKKAVEFGVDEQALASLVAKTKSGGGAPTDADWTTLQKMLEFPKEKLFPALDLMRLLALNENAAAGVTDHMWKSMVQALSTPGFPCAMLALKFFVNCVRWERLKMRLQADLGAVLDGAADWAHDKNTKTLNALVVLVQNIAVMLRGSTVDEEAKLQTLSICSELLDASTLSKAELMGVMSAVATLIWRDETTSLLLNDLGISAKLKNAETRL